MRPHSVQNVLFGYLPKTVNVLGSDTPIRTDFRTWLEVGEILRSDMSPERKAANVISLSYPEPASPVGAAFGAALAFYYAGFSRYGSGGKPALYSADFDGRVIYSGFMKCYGIDLSESDMHWHAFAPLMCELSGCNFSEILAVRSMDLSNIPGDRAKKYAEQKRRFMLPGGYADSDFADCISEVMT